MGPMCCRIKAESVWSCWECMHTESESLMSDILLYFIHMNCAIFFILRKQNWNLEGKKAILINCVAYVHCTTVWIIWAQISVDELENSISVKIGKEAVMNINNPGNLFMPDNGKLETKIYIAGLPNRTNSIIKQVSLSPTHTQTLPAYYTRISKLYMMVHVFNGKYSHK